jgi:membrane-associated protease RseP (regulator of RpoE activity)
LPANEEVQNEKAGQGRIEFDFPLLLVRISSFRRLFEKLGAWKASRLISWGTLFGMPIVGGFGLYMIFDTFRILLTTPEARAFGRELGLQAYISIPGLNPLLPIFYSWIGIIVAIIVHEGAHGVIARSIGIKIKSCVLIFLLAIPLGAGVDLDEEQMKKAKVKDSTRVLTSGIGANIIIALICIVGVIILVNGLSPVIDGLYIAGVVEDMPAEAAGLVVGDVIIRVDDNPTTTLNDLITALGEKNDTVHVTVARGEMWRDQLTIPVNLIEYEGKPFMGVSLSEMLIEERLRTYQKLATEVYSIHFQPPTISFLQSLTPFSETLHIYYTHTIGKYWYVLANLFFWIWYININVAILNSLPIYPLDGGRVFKNLLKGVVGGNEKTVSRVTYAVTIGIISTIVMMIALPYLL